MKQMPRSNRVPVLALAAAAAAALTGGAAQAADVVLATPFTLWVTETPAGGTAQFASQLKGGVRSYVFDGLGYAPGNVSLGATIAAGSLNDPSSVIATSSGSLLIADRGFNTGPGAVSRVTFTGGVPNPATVVLAGVATGPHQIALTGSGGLVVSSLGSGAQLYPAVSPPATVSFASGTERGAVTNGSLLYSTAGSGALQTFDLGTGALLGNFNVAGASLLHYGAMFGGSLWLADAGSNFTGAGGGIYRVTLDINGNPVSSARVANVNGAISVAFSPFGDEMFVADHFGGTLTGYALTGTTVAAASNLFIDGGTLASWGGAHVQYGGLAVTAAVPEPAAWASMLGGLAALLAWRVRPRSAVRQTVHSTAFTMSSTTFLASPNTIMVLSM